MERKVNISRQPAPLTEEEKQIRLQRRQKDTFDKFLARNAISRQQYEAGMKYIEGQRKSEIESLIFTGVRLEKVSLLQITFSDPIPMKNYV